MAETALGSLLVALAAGWMPCGIYYEGHRYRWVYIVFFYLVASLLSLLVGLFARPGSFVSDRSRSGPRNRWE